MEHFEGTVIRTDGRGFGIIEFNRRVDSAQHGYFTEKTRNFHKVDEFLDVGGKIGGVVEKTKQSVLPITEFFPSN